MLSKSEFQKQYKKLSETEKAEVKAFHENQFKTAIFDTTFDTAEKCLLWIREVEEGY